jgi:hypothetical protein
MLSPQPTQGCSHTSGRCGGRAVVIDVPRLLLSMVYSWQLGNQAQSNQDDDEGSIGDAPGEISVTYRYLFPKSLSPIGTLIRNC